MTSAREKTDRASSLVILLLTIALAFALRIYGLEHQNFWFDEAATSFIATRSYSEILSHIREEAVLEHPPLYYILIHPWLGLAGQSEFSYRFFSVIFGVLLPPLLYRFGRFLFDTRVALLSALIATISPFQIYYAQEARMYTLTAFWGLLSIYFLSWALASNRRIAWAALGLADAIGIGIHYYFVLVVVSQAIFLLLAYKIHKRMLVKWILFHVPSFLFGLIWFLSSHRLQVVFADFASRPLGMGRSWAEVAACWLALVIGPRSPSVRAGLLSLPFVPLFVLGATGAYQLSPGKVDAIPPKVRGTLLLVYTTVSPLVALFVPHLFLARYLGTVSPALCLLPALGLRVLRRRTAVLFGMGLAFLVAVNVYSLANYYTGFVKSEYGTMVQVIETASQPGDGIVLDSPWQYVLFKHYYKDDLPWYFLPAFFPSWLTPEPLTNNEVETTFQHLSTQHPRLWLVLADTEIPDPNNLAERWLTEHAYPVFKNWYVNNSRLVYYFLAAPGLTSYPEAEQVYFGDQFRLERCEVGPRSLAAGDAVRISLSWRTLVETDEDYVVILLLKDGQGRRWAQHEMKPQGGWRPTDTWAEGELVQDNHALMVPWGTPPGEYHLELQLYSPELGHSLVASHGDKTAARVGLDLGPIQISPSLVYPSKGHLSAQRVCATEFADQVELQGYDFLRGDYRSGDKLHLVLYWRALRDIQEEYNLLLQLVDSSDKVINQIIALPGASWYPTSRWKRNELVKGQHDIVIPPQAPQGKYLLRIVLFSPGSENLPVRRKQAPSLWERWWLSKFPSPEDHLDLTTIQVMQRQRRFSVPSMEHVVEADLGGKVELLGYDLATRHASPDGTLRLTLYWKALAQMNEDYTVFTHLISTDNRILGQQDNWPVKGTYPTWAWMEGEVVVDNYEIVIQPDTPPGEYMLEIGMYNGTIEQRLAVTDARGQSQGDRILLTDIHIGSYGHN
jgi:mannosyltransferase